MADDKQWNVKSFMAKRVAEEGIPPPLDINHEKTTDDMNPQREDVDPIADLRALEEARENIVQMDQPSIASSYEPWLDRQVNKFTNAFSCITPKNEFTESDLKLQERRMTEIASKAEADESPMGLVVKLQEMETVLNPTMTAEEETVQIFQQDNQVEEAPKVEDKSSIEKPNEGATTSKNEEDDAAATAEDGQEIEDPDSFDLMQPWQDPEKRTELDAVAGPPEQSRGGIDDDEKKTLNKLVSEKAIWAVFILLVIILVVLLAIVLPNRDDDESTNVDDPSSALSTPPTPSPSVAISPVSPTSAPTYGDPALEMKFNFDDFAFETSWELIDVDLGEVVFFVPPLTYKLGTKTMQYRMPVVFGRDYTFNIFDSGGNGLCCESPGNYTISFRGRVLAEGGGNFGDLESTTFTIPLILG